MVGGDFSQTENCQSPVAGKYFHNRASDSAQQSTTVRDTNCFYCIVLYNPVSKSAVVRIFV